MTWNVADLPDQSGRTIVVTGPTLGGLGHHTALELARRGARVVLGGRTPAKVEETAQAIRAEVPDAQLDAVHLDLASLASVRAAAAAAEQLGPIDVLVNNAGVMATPYSRTADGLELQMATNHFGPFLLTGLLLPQLVASGDGRVVTVSSLMHNIAGRAPLAEPSEESGRYQRWRVYGQTKLANLLFTTELDRRLREKELPVRALAAHPGFAGTHLAANGQYGRSRGGIASILDGTIRAVSQPAAAGAWPTLMAVTEDLPGDTFVGPGRRGQMAGPPRVVGRSKLAQDEAAAQRLWDLSERTVDLTYP
ncbi:SDR family NAD(P)-dependent oxidoreductase [Nocardioides sp. zg-536]|uniref:SDR family NAD(P)-dependent oxidoreductase n=1 Tax=Nocardioides faecalis TaxID=2803858 RepID=A0A938Y6U1_9ACTN|nr:oxidoreductase [Nocardioides faecalis]MBM9458571.1 SDR family NAD(P)-dependent oxidoreductase [Nocardioides faecalis]QVI58573.1 SDR family NAD(P)-dependent oxidoreductase [Nocardioides faecalis]